MDGELCSPLGNPKGHEALFEWISDVVASLSGTRHCNVNEVVEAGRVADAEALAERLRDHIGAGDAAQLSAALAGAYAQQTDPVGVLRHCDAVRHAPSLPPRLRAELLANEGFALLLAGRVDDAEALGQRAIEAGDRHAAPNATHAGRGVLCLCALATGRGRDALAMATETAKSWPSEYGTIILQMTLLNEDRLADTDRLLRASQSRLVESGYLIAQPALQANSGLALLLAGKLDDALVQAEAGLALAEQTNVPVITAAARGVIARVALHHGSVTEAEAALGPTQPVRGLGVDDFEWATALILETQGDVTAAREALNSIWDSPFRYIISWLGVGPDLIRLHLAAGDRDQAASVATAVERGASGSDAPSAAGAALRCRALVDSDPALMRRATPATSTGPRARNRRRQGGCRLPARRDRGGRAGARRPGGIRGSRCHRRRDPGASLLTRGVRLGVRGARQRPATGWDSLTPTERQVVALAAEGLTSRQIGDRLYISTFTVGTHLRHVYQKLGINSRLQLAADTRRHSRNDIG